MSSPCVWGELTFEPGLTKEESYEIIETTGSVNFAEGDNFLSFDGCYFYPDDILYLFEDRTDMDGSITAHGDDYTETYIFKGNEIKQYYQNFVWDMSDEEMIEELEKRGYTITKGE